MTRSHFVTVKSVPLEQLFLDVSNARIRGGADQADCIARILRKPKQLIALANDIAEHGLSTAPILVERTGRKKFVIWDGNRRITALKILNDPTTCKVVSLRHQFEAIRQRAKVPIPASVDVLSSEDQSALLEEVLKRHAGAQDGAGQLNWNAFLRTVFLLGHNRSAADKRAGQLFLWAEEHGVEVDDEFPITSMTRFLNKSNLAKLGFAIDDAGVSLSVDRDIGIAVVQKIASDFSPNGSMQVGAVFTAGEQEVYIDEVRLAVGLDKFNAAEADAADEKSGDDGLTGHSTDSTPSPKNPRSQVARSATKPRGPRKQSWERRYLFSRTGAPGFSVPADETKASNIVTELRLLNPHKTPLAVAALFRMLIEFSTKSYIRRHRTLTHKNEMHRTIAAVADYMHQAGELDEGEHKAVIRRTRENHGLLNYDTLNAYIHALKAHPTGEGLNTLWDEIDTYVKACWRR